MRIERFFDTNVLVYAVSPDDSRFSTASELLAKSGSISVQVLNEFALVLRRKSRLPWPEILDALGNVRRLFPEPLPILLSTHDLAITMAQRHGFKIYDAVIVASALEAGCDTLCTEDLQDGQIIDGRLTIRNPFAAA